MFAFIGLVLIALCIGLLFIPQFALVRGVTSFENPNLRPISGIEFFIGKRFGEENNYLAQNLLGKDAKPHVSAAGIITLILMVFSAASLLTRKYSSLLSLFGGLFLAVSGILLLLTPLYTLSVYDGKITAYWLAYVLGGILLAYGAFLTYLGIMLLRDEKNALSAPKSHQYSYINKKK